MTLDGDDVPKQGMTHKINYAQNTVSLVIPRALLGQPRWVRVGGWNELWPPIEDTTYLQDNPSGDRRFGPLTPRLYRS